MSQDLLGTTEAQPSDQTLAKILTADFYVQANYSPEVTLFSTMFGVPTTQGLTNNRVTTLQGNYSANRMKWIGGWASSKLFGDTLVQPLITEATSVLTTGQLSLVFSETGLPIKTSDATTQLNIAVKYRVHAGIPIATVTRQCHAYSSGWGFPVTTEASAKPSEIHVAGLD
jgi:hypothetical protein